MLSDWAKPKGDHSHGATESGTFRFGSNLKIILVWAKPKGTNRVYFFLFFLAISVILREILIISCCHDAISCSMRVVHQRPLRGIQLIKPCREGRVEPPPHNTSVSSTGV